MLRITLHYWRTRSVTAGSPETSMHQKGPVMSATDKIKNAGEEAGGKVKEAAGKATGNEDLEASGQADQASANVKQAGEKAKDAVKDVLD